jgi:adenylylsulfate kinase
MGLSGSGKTTLTKELLKILPNSESFNADEIRTQYNDWDFSDQGRIRQCERMKKLAEESKANYVICDFIAPTNEIRQKFNADFLVFVDTIDSCKYKDTNNIFEKPSKYDIRVDSKHAVYWAFQIKKELQSK